MSQDTHSTHQHVSSRKMYFAVFAALLVLTFATVLVARVDLGVMNDVVALGIAVTKAVLPASGARRVCSGAYSGRPVAAGGSIRRA